jgi:hypothetical protein
MDPLLNNIVYLLFLTMLLTLTVFQQIWVKVFFNILSVIYSWFLWSTGQYLFFASLFIIETFLLYNILKTVFHNM